MIPLPTSILITCEVRGDTRRYRSIHLVEQFRLLGVNCEFIHLADLAMAEKLKRHWTVVIFQRAAYGRYLSRLLEHFRRDGSLILSDFDDLIFDVSAFPYINSPDFSDPIRVSLYKQTMRNIRETLDYSDGCLASTDFLADRIRQVGKPVWVHRNAFSQEMLSQSEIAYKGRVRDSRSQCVLGYASGTPTHNKDFVLIKPVLIEVMKKYPWVELQLVGPLDPGNGWGDLENRIHRQKLVPWRKLPEVLAGFDINLAPLIANNPFAQSKSEIKWMEAAMVGVPSVATPTDAFCHAIRQGENGLIAAEAADWHESLAKLVENSGFREQLGETARQDVLRNYNPAARAYQLAGVLDEISLQLCAKPFFAAGPLDSIMIEQQVQEASQPRKQWMPSAYEREPSNFQLGIYSLRNRGLKHLAFSAWVYFRRLIAPWFPFQVR